MDLNTKLTGRVVFPDSPGYEQAYHLWNLRFNTEYPSAIVFAQNKQDIVNAIKWSRKNNFQFRARSGRHSIEGWSTIDGGIIIDVSEMKKMRIDKKKRKAVVQTGLTQGELVPALYRAGFAIPTGEERTPGLGGVVLGGGIGQLNRRYGLACDNLIGVEMVLASGEVVYADKNHHSDLLWACRGGGGGNFGIATEYTFKIHPISDVVMYQLNWKYKYLKDVFKVWQNLIPFADDRLGSVLTSSSKQQNTVSVYGIYLGSEVKLSKILKPLLAIDTPNVTIKTVPYIEAWETLAGTDDSPVIWKTASAFAYKPLPQEALTVFRNHLDNPPTPDASIWCLGWGGAISNVSPTATAFFHRNPLIYVEWGIEWKEESQAKDCVAWAESFRNNIQPYVKGAYVNVPDIDYLKWPKVYYGDNFERLQKIKNKYDPTYAFQYQQAVFPSKTL